jgi:hypothetical protein
MKNIYCDLDGVLFDFDTRLKEIFNNNIPTDKEVLWNKLKQYPNLYDELRPYDLSVMFMDFVTELCIEYNYHLCILTAIPRRDTIPLAEEHKRESVKRYFDNIDFKIGPYAKDKQKHYQPGDILIDDKESNILEWQAKGGNAILHKDFTSTLKILIEILKKENN